MNPVLAAASVLGLVLSSGCVITEGDPDRFPPHNETKSQEYPNFEGLVVKGTLSGGGPEVALDATARNEGPHTYKVSSICSSPWHEQLVSSLGPVSRGPPSVSCAAFGLKEFKPGESETFHTTWNGTLWDSRKEGFVDAASGTYTWHLSFEAYSGGKESYDYEGRDRIPVEFEVTVE